MPFQAGTSRATARPRLSIRPTETAEGEQMSSRSWFYASEGQQLGPYAEVQLREFIARGSVRADTLVWTGGMAGWQKAGEIPGLMSGASGPPVIPQAGGPPVVGDAR